MRDERQPHAVRVHERQDLMAEARFGLRYLDAIRLKTVPPEGNAARGHFQLHFDGTRWWIAGWIFDAEAPGNPIPKEFLPPDERG